LQLKLDGLSEFTLHGAYICLGGKRDEDLILPINDSLSVTLSQDQVDYLL